QQTIDNRGNHRNVLIIKPPGGVAHTYCDPARSLRNITHTESTDLSRLKPCRTIPHLSRQLATPHEINDAKAIRLSAPLPQYDLQYIYELPNRNSVPATPRSTAACDAGLAVVTLPSTTSTGHQRGRRR